MANIFSNTSKDTGTWVNKTVITIVWLVLLFLALCWGIWCFFDYKITRIEPKMIGALITTGRLPDG